MGYKKMRPVRKYEKRGGISLSSIIDIYTLGSFEIHNGDEVITQGVKKNSKCWQLLQYLITYRNKNVGREELIMELDLKNNSDPEGALSALVYRIRQRLENGAREDSDHFIKTTGSAYTLNGQQEYWLDAEEFEKLCNMVQKDEEPEQLVEKFSRALDLYEGDYLEDARLVEWVWSTRNYYRDLLVSTLLAVDSLLSEMGDFEQLWQFYSRIQQLVRFDERLMMGEIETLLKAGRTGMARQKYEEAVNMFEHNDLKLPPRLEKLGHSLKSSFDEDPVPFLKELQKMGGTEGAFVCEPALFSQLYELEKRRIQREIPPRYILHIQLTGLQGEKKKEKLGETFFTHLQGQLRAGDIACHWSDLHIIVLLVDINEKGTKKVLARLKKSYSALYSPPEGLEFNSRICKI